MSILHEVQGYKAPFQRLTQATMCLKVRSGICTEVPFALGAPLSRPASRHAFSAAPMRDRTIQACRAHRQVLAAATPCGCAVPSAV